jgi:hypothetical protein
LAQVPGLLMGYFLDSTFDMEEVAYFFDAIYFSVGWG